MGGTAKEPGGRLWEPGSQEAAGEGGGNWTGQQELPFYSVRYSWSPTATLTDKHVYGGHCGQLFLLWGQRG